MEITRTRTKIVARSPKPAITIPPGTLGGARHRSRGGRERRARRGRRRRRALEQAVCQPVMETVNPTSASNVYQLMNVLSASTRPPSQASPSPGFGTPPWGASFSAEAPSKPEDVLDLLPDRERDDQVSSTRPSRRKRKRILARAPRACARCARRFARARASSTLDRIGVDGRVFRTWPMRGGDRWSEDVNALRALPQPVLAAQRRIMRSCGGSHTNVKRSCSRA